MTVPEAEEVDLSTMTFDERLDYLAALEQEKPIPPEDPDNDDLFGVDDSLPEAQFWTLDFWRLIMEDLKTIEWPTRTQSLQTVVSSQIAFVVILVLCLVFDATVESGVRSLVTGSDFGVSWDAILKKR